MGSSMVVEFTRKEDLEQACYEATVDITRYIAHLDGIAFRCEENFPEVAAGLRGSAAGIGQYLKGIDGEWKTWMNSELHKVLSRPEFEDHLWAYEFCRDPRAALMLIGAMAAVASAKEDLTFWEVLKVARGKFSDMEPLIEQLLGSSPMRKKQ